LVPAESPGVHRLRVGAAGSDVPEELDPAVRLTPRLARVVDRDRRRTVRAHVPRVAGTGLREPDDPQIGSPGEVGGVDVGPPAGSYGRDRAQRRSREKVLGNAADPR